MKKRILLVVIAALLVLTLAACGKKGLEGRWKYVSGDAGEFGEYGEEFYLVFDDGKMSIDIDWEKAGLEGSDLELAKGLMQMMTITYEVKSDTELEVSLSILGESQTDTVEYKIEGNKLTFADAEFERK
jgi:hypothetical protein